MREYDNLNPEEKRRAVRLARALYAVFCVGLLLAVPIALFSLAFFLKCVLVLCKLGWSAIPWP